MSHDELSDLVGMSIGMATVCWENLEGAGVFQSEIAAAIALNLIETIWAEFEHQQRVLL